MEILHQGVAMFFRSRRFQCFRAVRLRLFFLKRLPFCSSPLHIGRARRVGQKVSMRLPDGNHFRLVNNGLAQLLVLASIFVGIKYNSRHNKSQVPMKCNWLTPAARNR